jgi:hypothetical protein
MPCLLASQKWAVEPLLLGCYFVAIADLETQLGFGKDCIAVTENFLLENYKP